MKLVKLSRSLLVLMLMGACGGGGDDGGMDTSDAGDDTSDLAWAGTWAATGVYDVACDNGLAPAARDTGVTGNWTLILEGDNSNITAEIDTIYFMQGVGTDSTLTLNGAFPARGTDGNLASNAADIVMNITIDTVTDSDTVLGSVSGTFELTSNGGASDCTVENGTMMLSR